MSYNDTISRYIRSDRPDNPFIKWFIVYTFIGIFCGWLGGMVMSFLVLDQRKEKNIGFILNNPYQKDTCVLHKNDESPLKKNRIFSLQPIITNFNSSPKNWLRLDIAVICEDIPDDVFLETMHQDIMDYVHTVSLQQITGPQGFLYFKEDIKERLKLRSKGFISNVIVRTFIIA
ncbi:flagellar basal body-associated FliL family protein [Candidatus Liberibacter africanus]|uniref:Flagellar protein FliL n=1 Tax=Candidatus Liberibacter africanus PTSAPSY TaxID=1277257 RepID=A0A0G3I429_LIBAF|nr:flagellar basal body-associated FliL family protein [Candidatus Liberibacter africanus]AKK19975.1 flagellar basal body-associated protein FliL [Candidatus Liberibacter africanus PTSAPSY]QTP63808.1 flagellar basal body-associated FliL family protein [Candidatus Liberibacter africanus]